MNCKVCWASDEQVAASFLVSKALKIPVIYKFKMQIWNFVLKRGTYKQFSVSWNLLDEVGGETKEKGGAQIEAA